MEFKRVEFKTYAEVELEDNVYQRFSADDWHGVFKDDINHRELEAKYQEYIKNLPPEFREFANNVIPSYKNTLRTQITLNLLEEKKKTKNNKQD